MNLLCRFFEPKEGTICIGGRDYEDIALNAIQSRIGVVLQTLRETGLDQNTIVVFTSDHGDMDGAHLRIHKSCFYEESARVPFIIAGPGIKSGVDRQHLVSASFDLIPTICDFANVKVPTGLAGYSVKPLALGNSESDWREAVYSENGRGRMVRTARFKYCWYKTGQPCDMLIDMQNDPGEMVNLVGDPKYASIVAKHRELIKKHVAQQHDTLFAKYVAPQ